MKKLIRNSMLLSLLITPYAFASSFMMVQCPIYYYSTNQATYSKPGDDTLFVAKNCAAALNKVPNNYVLLSSKTSADTSSTGTIAYLFGTLVTSSAK